ncbi:hypothetical protein CRYUN_Cryun28dG0086200 [Craigia yunnanensis]
MSTIPIPSLTNRRNRKFLKLIFQLPPPHPPLSLSRNSVFALSATLLSALVASVAIFSGQNGNDASEANHNPRISPLYDSIEHTIHKSNESFKRIVHHAKQTGVAASVLWQSLRSVMSSANHEVRTGFELRVASLLADIAAANAGRRAAIVSASGGAVVDWLLETVAVGKTDVCGTQAEAARALAYLIADPDVRKDVLGRPRAVPNLLRFIFSCQPQNKSKRHSGRSSFDISDSLKGRSMLVAAIMDIVTSNCDSVEKVSFKPWLPGNAEMRDIAAAIQVIEEGGMRLDEGERNDDDDDGRGMKGIGIKILEGTTVLGLSRTSELMKLDHSNDTHVGSDKGTPKTLALLSKHDSSVGQANLSAVVVPGLWDDLHCQHVAVPFAAWALADWAMASEINRSHIEELDQDGEAVMTALLAPERSVKWHGSLVARLLLEDRNLPLNDSVSDWASSLLSTASHASKNEDISLSQMALSAFIVAVERSLEARRTVMEKGLELMRVTAKRTAKHHQVQEPLAKALELLSTEDMHLSLDESQKWSGILLSWVFRKSSSNAIRSSSIRILSCILEDQGPSSVPISQAWLALLLNDILSSCKASSVKGGTQPKSNKVKVRRYANCEKLAAIEAYAASRAPEAQERVSSNAVNSVPETSSTDGTNICPHWKCPGNDQSTLGKDTSLLSEVDSMNSDNTPVTQVSDVGDSSSSFNVSENDSESEIPQMDIVFVHGLRGGPYKTWHIAEDKSSTKSGLVEKIDEEAGKLGTFWPGEWLLADFPQARLSSLKYKTNLTQWSGASLPLQEVSTMLLKKLVAAGIGNRPVVFLTHSTGGLVVKQILYKAKAENMDNLVNNTIGVVSAQILDTCNFNYFIPNTPVKKMEP